MEVLGVCRLSQKHETTSIIAQPLLLPLGKVQTFQHRVKGVKWLTPRSKPQRGQFLYRGNGEQKYFFRDVKPLV